MARQVQRRIPTSRAKTAYGLLSEVARLVIAEPARLHMDTFLRRGEAAVAYVEGDKSLLPACGTIGCICGWVTMLAGSKRDIAKQIRVAGELPYEQYRGAKILGLEWPRAGELFNDYVGLEGSTPGTQRHAELVVARIANFQKKYAAQLKAKKLVQR